MENISEETIWGIHSEDDQLFLGEKIIAIGWNDMGNLGGLAKTRDAFRARFMQVYPHAKKGAIPTSVGMLYRFAVEMKIGDYVVFPSKIDRKINIGRISGDYMYDPSAGLYHHTRKVTWLKHLSRTVFSQGALYEVGSAMTLFSIKNYAAEYLASLSPDFPLQTTDIEDESVGATAEEIMNNTRDFVLKELSRLFKGYDLERFVADLLNAMGYRTSISPHGGDGGIDIVAYKDELPPRIAVQVKSQDSAIKEAIIQSLKGAMMPGDYGLFISLSDYTKNAQKFLTANPIIRGINGIELVDLVLKYYENMSEEYQQMIPLKKVYIPKPKDV